MLQIHVNVCDIVLVLAGVLQCNGRKLEEAEDFKCVFVIYFVRIEIDQPQCISMSNNSLFVSKLYEEKSLTLRAPDLIFFTTDVQTVNYYSTIHC